MVVGLYPWRLGRAGSRSVEAGAVADAGTCVNSETVCRMTVRWSCRKKTNEYSARQVLFCTL